MAYRLEEPSDAARSSSAGEAREVGPTAAAPKLETAAGPIVMDHRLVKLKAARSMSAMAPRTQARRGTLNRGNPMTNAAVATTRIRLSAKRGRCRLARGAWLAVAPRSCATPAGLARAATEERS